MKYRKKPVVIEATQFFIATEPWPEGVERYRPTIEELERFLTAGGKPSVMPDGYSLVIKTLEGPLFVTEGDWIITGVKGERYPCKPDIFAATYEKL